MQGNRRSTASPQHTHATSFFIMSNVRFFSFFIRWFWISILDLFLPWAVFDWFFLVMLLLFQMIIIETTGQKLDRVNLANIITWAEWQHDAALSLRWAPKRGYDCIPLLILVRLSSYRLFWWTNFSKVQSVRALKNAWLASIIASRVWAFIFPIYSHIPGSTASVCRDWNSSDLDGKSSELRSQEPTPPLEVLFCIL